ncbi:MAG TPA: UDP-N-acetylglucosamine 1-carboxyvinyltransferase [Candidatus Margulisiibacteriota bacterium]|nr:UDP-N-acetylglucosamine 1-carboxyvinyltransferase [Candidatus Margulisiibacteriota bacterium]
MDTIQIRGGRRLKGEVTVEGAKNAALPILLASLLTSERCTFRNVPRVVDVRTTLRLLADLGARVDDSDGVINVQAERLARLEAQYELVKTMRASFLSLGPLLARFGQARVSTPGGCAIGSRPVDLHLDGLQKMGARVRIVHGYVEAEAEALRGARIYLDFPSVGATEHLVMVATLAEGTTTIEHAAREPEVVDLARALNAMGAKITGAGEDIITIEGVPKLHGVDFTIIPDRIEAGTFMMAAAITGGDVYVRGARSDHLQAVTLKLREAGVELQEDSEGIRVIGNGRLRSVDVKTMPYPGFPTDLQAQMMAVLSLADGRSVISETIFENRFMHVLELNRMGADIKVEGNNAIVRGVAVLSGAPVMATDLRASVCLVLAGLAADGATEVSRVYHLDRGYVRIEEKLSALGAGIRRVRQQRG